METKKTTKANLEKTKAMNLLMGVIVAMSFVFASFEWSTTDVMVFEDVIRTLGPEDPLPPITPPDAPEPPPPPPARIEIPQILNEVPDDALDDGAEVDLGTEANNEPSPVVPPGFGNYIDEVEIAEDKIFEIVETKPEFPGGDAALMNFLAQAVKYPVVAQENGIQGRVTVSFVVNKDGSIVDAEIVRGIDASLDKEALRVVNAMPKWKPGKQRDKTVRVKYTMPIRFKLQN